jgi:uncharacterized heparinase superfamily protein
MLDRLRRSAIMRPLRSSLVRWQAGVPSEELLIAPPDLRSPDPSFASELAEGTLGLAGAVAHLEGRSPFAIAPPTRAWARALHGFAWLRHVDASDSAEAHNLARKLVQQWLARSAARRWPAWEPDVTGRRILSWLSHFALLLEGGEPGLYAALMRSLGKQLDFLGARWRQTHAGYPRVLTLVALVQGHLCIAGHQRPAAEYAKQLAEELERQILADGGHVSRNPAVLIELLLDLLPLRRCMTAVGQSPPEGLLEAIRRLAPMLRALRLGEGTLARFNGMSVTERDLLATVLAYDDGHSALLDGSGPSGYVRLERGATVILVDAGPAPPLEVSGAAHAGCLSFEMSSGAEALFVNCGAPGPAHQIFGAAARATANHNTLCVNEQSSSMLVRRRLAQWGEAPPIRHPDRVLCRVTHAEDGSARLEASHDGYKRRFRLIHTRALKLEASGERLEGCDKLGPDKGVLRFASDVPFAIHFHLHPRVDVRLGRTGHVDLTLASGERWRLAARGAALSIEESTFYADPLGPRRTLQLVLRATCCGLSEVTWSLERIARARGPAPAAGGSA